jgi:hypothetical protein
MNSSTVRLIATCDFCKTKNELTMSETPPGAHVKCSSCGGLLGTFESLMDRAKEDDVQIVHPATVSPAEDIS